MAIAAVVGAGLADRWANRWYDRGLKELIPVAQRLDWVVDRPAEVKQVVAALRRRGEEAAGITVAVHGAGGFGKTTVAKMVRVDRRVLRRFRGRVYWVTLGRDAGRQNLAGLVNDLVAQVDRDRAKPIADARQAGEHLAAVLAKGPRRLLILDDVWSEDQLAVFPVAGRCARLVTTRNSSLAAAGHVPPVKVDQMSRRQARELLSAGLPPLPPAAASDLIEETGRCPLLLRLVNKILDNQAKLQPDISEAAEELLARLHRRGALQVDELTGAGRQNPDVSDPDQRSKSVQASTGLLSEDDRQRLGELTVFARDTDIPVTLITALWQATGGLDHPRVTALCARLADLALVTLIRGDDGGAVAVHDVIRDFLQDQLSATRLEPRHEVLLNAAAQKLSSSPLLTGSGMATTAWWDLPESARYLREHLIEHLLAAGRAWQAEELATDLRWVGMRLEFSGPAAPYADLALVSTPRSRRLGRVLGQAAHLLAPTDPPHSLIDILYSRVGHDPDWAAQAEILSSARTLPALANKWPLPDLPDPALVRTLTGHNSSIEAVGIAPDGTWVATACLDGTVRIWDVATGRQRVVFTKAFGVNAMAIAPDGTWLATGGGDRKVCTWDTATGQLRAVLKGHQNYVSAVVIAPDGSWLATASHDRTVRIWDAATGRARISLTGHSSWVSAIAVAPDGSWLATGSEDGTVRIWDAVTGQQRAVLTGHTRLIKALAIAPDGTWLASASYDHTVRIWDADVGRTQATLTGHLGRVWAVAIAPDGTWLATGGERQPGAQEDGRYGGGILDVAMIYCLSIASFLLIHSRSKLVIIFTLTSRTHLICTALFAVCIVDTESLCGPSGIPL